MECDRLDLHRRSHVSHEGLPGEVRKEALTTSSNYLLSVSFYNVPTSTPLEKVQKMSQNLQCPR